MPLNPTPIAAAPSAASRTEQLLPLVQRIARQYHRKLNGSIESDDLAQVGLLALVEAERGFDDRGIDFAHYAVIRVRGAMIDLIRREGRMTRAAIAGRRAIRWSSRIVVRQRHAPLPAILVSMRPVITGCWPGRAAHLWCRSMI